MGKRGSRKIKSQPLYQWLREEEPRRLRWIDLPADLTENILQRLGPVEILEIAQNVCATWRTVCQDPAMWRFIDMTYYSHSKTRFFLRFRRTCRRAVDHSKGELVAINIQNFGDDYLLLYISQRSSHLRRLKIENGGRVSGKGLTAAVSNLPELEELHLGSMRQRINSKDIRTVGICCPLLKSFTLDGRVYRGRCKDNRAMAIARNMPNLRHLGLFGNELSDEGVKAILDGCPHLESIDLRECYNLHEDKQLCFESIFDVRRLFDHPTPGLFDQWDDEYGYWDNWASDYSLDHCFTNSDYGNYFTDDDDDDADDDLGYNYLGDDAGQIEVNCWDAMDMYKKGEFVQNNFH